MSSSRCSVFAMQFHTVRAESKELIVHACWDSDRLDLGRVGITPDPDRMLIKTAKNICFHHGGGAVIQI